VWQHNQIFTSNQYLCPQISVFPHFSLHGMCIRPCMHSPHVPWHRWSQLSMAPHGIWHRDSSSSENGSKTRQTTSKLINPLLSSKQPCVLETQMMQDVRVSTQRYQEVNCPRMWCCVIGQTTFSSITVLLSSGPGISSWPVQPLKMKVPWSLTMLGTTHPLTVSNLRRPESSAMNPTVTISWDMHQNHWWHTVTGRDTMWIDTVSGLPIKSVMTKM